MATPVRATYRLQLNRSFGFDAAAELADYLAALGVSHVYASPVLQAAAGSEHGYDVVDCDRVSDQLGGAGGLQRMAASLRAHGLGIVLDVVPNHMALTADNALWWDVLENGPASQYARFFDVDWDAAADNRVLLPILGERYFDALERGAIQLRRTGSAFAARYHEHALPAAPRSLQPLLSAAAARAGSDVLAFIADALSALPHPWTSDRASAARRRRDKAVLYAQLAELLGAEPRLAAEVDRELAALEADRTRLDAWLERQNWRLAYWRAAATELGYRRFFDIQSLGGLRVEDPEVFERTHALVLSWIGAGLIDGLRVDHPDGLRDPEQYLQRLRAAAPGAYLVVEKILQPGERLRASWPVAGTTGYELIRLQDQLQVEPRGAAALAALYEQIAGPAAPFEQQVREAKLLVIDRVLASERERMVELAMRMTRDDRALRDCTRDEMRAAVRELLASFPVYRTYVSRGAAPAPEDPRLIAGALQRAAAQRPEVYPRVWQALGAALQLRAPHPSAQDFGLTLQQLSGAITAKAVEDTVFYRHVPLCALNEVGGSPEQLGLSLAEFHAELQARAQGAGLSASSTHDTKRGEDVRTRLLVLCEHAQAWQQAVERWLLRAAGYASGVDAATQYLFLQTLAGAHPLPLERALPYMRKAVREAKLHSSWTRPDAEYEAAVERFVRGAYDDGQLMAEVAALVASIAPAGYAASLAKTLVKLTVPGVPDLYQGSELWDLCLVDPDNRRAVDYGARRALASRVVGLQPEVVARELQSGAPKLWLIARTLRLRAREPERFAGAYTPLPVRGDGAEAVLAFARGDDAQLLVVVPRWPARAAALAPDVRVELPAGRYRCAWSGAEVDAGAAGTAVRTLWARFPVALLVRR